MSVCTQTLRHSGIQPCRRSHARRFRHSYTRTCIHEYIRIFLHSYLDAFMCSCIHSGMHTSIHIPTHPFLQHLHVHIQICIRLRMRKTIQLIHVPHYIHPQIHLQAHLPQRQHTFMRTSTDSGAHVYEVRARSDEVSNFAPNEWRVVPPATVSAINPVWKAPSL